MNSMSGSLRFYYPLYCRSLTSRGLWSNPVHPEGRAKSGVQKTSTCLRPRHRPESVASVCCSSAVSVASLAFCCETTKKGFTQPYLKSISLYNALMLTTLFCFNVAFCLFYSRLLCFCCCGVSFSAVAFWATKIH